MGIALTLPQVSGTTRVLAALVGSAAGNAVSGGEWRFTYGNYADIEMFVFSTPVCIVFVSNASYTGRKGASAR